jgi:hypothetical protein
MTSKKLFSLFSLITLLAIGVFLLSQAGIVSAAVEWKGVPGRPGGNNQGSGQVGSGYALTPLSTAEQSALQSAILEEYGALNLYQSAITQLGNVYPFSQIVRSEQQHINALVRQATKYGVTVPANPGLSTQPTFTTLAQACQAGVNAEIADAALYDTLKPVTTHTDLLQVYNNLQSASLNSHLPAFQTCD